MMLTNDGVVLIVPQHLLLRGCRWAAYVLKTALLNEEIVIKLITDFIVLLTCCRLRGHCAFGFRMNRFVE